MEVHFTTEFYYSNGVVPAPGIEAVYNSVVPIPEHILTEFICVLSFHSYEPPVSLFGLPVEYYTMTNDKKQHLSIIFENFPKILEKGIAFSLEVCYDMFVR